MAHSLGTTLQAARKQRGLSLSDAAHQTRIPIQRLQYLEDDNFAAFGSFAYARSFLRLYCRFLGVDASPILSKLPQGRLGGPKDFKYLTTTGEKWVAHSSKEPTTSPRKKKRHTTIPGSPVHAGMAIFAILFICTGIWGNYMAQRRTDSHFLQTADSRPSEISARYQNLSARVALPQITEQKMLKPASTGPKEIEKLLSERAGKARTRGIE